MAKATKQEKKEASKRIQTIDFNELAKMDHEEPKDTEMVAEDNDRPEDLDDDDDDLPEGVMGEQLDSAFQDSKEAQMMVQQAQKEYTENNLFKV